MSPRGNQNTRIVRTQNIEQPSPCDIQGTFGWKLRNERYKQGISQEELAEMAGCSVDTVKRYEKGIAGMKLEMAWYLAEALRVPFESLLPERNNTANRY